MALRARLSSKPRSWRTGARAVRPRLANGDLSRLLALGA